MASQLTIEVDLFNNTKFDAYAYVWGYDAQSNPVFLQADGCTLYNVPMPSKDHQKIDDELISIKLTSKGTIPRRLHLPPIISGRVYFSLSATLAFYANKPDSTTGGSIGIAPPTPLDEDDTQWSFCELTFEADGSLYANISFVDFVGIPTALELQFPDAKKNQNVRGLPENGLQSICSALRNQATTEHVGWDKLIFPVDRPQPLRVLSANLRASCLENYFEPYVKNVWNKYKSTKLIIDTQNDAWGVFSGAVDANDNLVLTSRNDPKQPPFKFSAPATADIFSCVSGPFQAADSEHLKKNLIARLSAALNRSTLLGNADQPQKEKVSAYYAEPITNHYSRIVHQSTLDHLGYAFPYDDVQSTEGPDNGAANNVQGSVSCNVNRDKPTLFKITISTP